MKTIMTAALMSLMLAPAAFAAAPMLAKTAAKPALSSETTQGGAVLLVKGGDKPGKASTSSKGKGGLAGKTAYDG